MCLASYKKIIFFVLWSFIFCSQDTQTNRNLTNTSIESTAKRIYFTRVVLRTDLQAKDRGCGNISVSWQPLGIQITDEINPNEAQRSSYNSSHGSNAGVRAHVFDSNVNAFPKSGELMRTSTGVPRHCNHSTDKQSYIKSLKKPLVSKNFPPKEFRKQSSLHQTLQGVFKSVLSFKDDSQSDLPQIHMFLNNQYFLHVFFEQNTEKNYTEFIKNICFIERQLIETQPNFSASFRMIFEEEIDKISIFTKNDEIIARSTFLISLKRFFKERLESIDVSKRCFISVFLAMKSIESILLLTRERLYTDNLRLIKKSNHSIYKTLNDVLDKNSNTIIEIIFVVCSFGLNLNDDYLKILNIMSIGIKRRNVNSIVSKLKSSTNLDIDFITDLGFLFESNEIKKIVRAYNSTASFDRNCLNTETFSQNFSSELEKILNEKNFIIQIIEYYSGIFSDTKLQFFNTTVRPKYVDKQYNSLITRSKELFRRNDQDTDSIQDLQKLRLHAFSLFHFVLNYCYNNDINSKNFLRLLETEFKKLMSK
ncbi:hypothetical protein CWI36_0012p0060 [Hamiltosporidium magnivora]|uniref:Uncharacterized protein n=1 Tax=Hamiltosporidium magnivora TaxID=148818 RepID=A0A4Q9LMQ3_9MICR|nr:hypothetical protein CWI36_0050p0040 [Hamiltosporidium magnivora]TBU09649.1 hypothetical protein CWI36_0012p0060 [Hamiltosporidium magnivora]